MLAGTSPAAGADTVFLPADPGPATGSEPHSDEIPSCESILLQQSWQHQGERAHPQLPGDHGHGGTHLGIVCLLSLLQKIEGERENCLNGMI